MGEQRAPPGAAASKKQKMRRVVREKKKKEKQFPDYIWCSDKSARQVIIRHGRAQRGYRSD